MRQVLAITLLVVAAAALAQGQESNGQKKAAAPNLTQMFTQLENEWAKADNSKDTKVLDRILADDWTYLGASGVQTKVQHLTELKSGGGDLEFETLADIKVRIYGETAVVNGSAYQKNSDKSKDTGRYVWTDVFVKRHGRWQAVNSQDTRVSAH